MAKSKKTTFIIIGVVSSLIAVSLLFALNSDRILRAVGVSKTAPIFIFNESKAPGWWAGANYNSRASTVAEDYEGSEPIDMLPVAGMTVLKGKQGEYATACFVMFSYYDYKVDVAKLKKDKDSEVSASASMKNIGEDTLSINAFGTAKNFILTKYQLIGPEAKDAMQGMSYGWVELEEGYISVSGVCPTGSELNDTFAAIDAIALY